VLLDREKLQGTVKSHARRKKKEKEASNPPPPHHHHNLLFVSIAADTHSPVHHTKSAVGEHFHIPAEYARVKFSAPIKVHYSVTGGSTVRGGREILALEG
jgi:hypothetical protein